VYEDGKSVDPMQGKGSAEEIEEDCRIGRPHSGTRKETTKYQYLVAGRRNPAYRVHCTLLYSTPACMHSA